MCFPHLFSTIYEKELAHTDGYVRKKKLPTISKICYLCLRGIYELYLVGGVYIVIMLKMDPFYFLKIIFTPRIYHTYILHREFHMKIDLHLLSAMIKKSGEILEIVVTYDTCSF